MKTRIFSNIVILIIILLSQCPDWKASGSDGYIPKKKRCSENTDMEVNGTLSRVTIGGKAE